MATSTAIENGPGAATTAHRERLILGHPVGLAYLVFAEAWERFAFYGMQALLVLYMGRTLLSPGHAEHVAGLAGLKAVLERAYGPLSPAALASAVFGLYAGGVYLTPLAGGWVADRLIGRTRAVALGAVLAAAGHFLMAFEASFLPALLCLLAGVGLFKGNIATQVGELYAPGDGRRTDAFQVYMLGISLAVIVSPLVCGTLGERVAWHWGFGAAGVAMLVGLAVYLAGRRHLPPEPPRGTRARATPRARLARGEVRAVVALLALLPALTLSALGNQEIFNAYLVWGGAHYQLVLLGRELPTTWLVSLDAFISSGVLAGTVVFWRWWRAHRREPDEITKLTVGAAISALAPLVLALASVREAATGRKVGLAWGLGFHLLNDVGFANLFAVGLALFSRAAPRSVVGAMFGVYYLHLFAANMAVGWLGGRLEHMAPASFWLLHAALIGAGAALMAMLRLVFGRTLAPTAAPGAETVG